MICYHYTTRTAAQKIVEAAVIKPSIFVIGLADRFVWLSTRRDFEPSVTSRPDGLVRFSFLAKGMLTFAEAQRRNLTEYQGYMLVALAKNSGARPETDWRAHAGPLAVADNLICIEEWQSGIEGERDGWRIIDERSLIDVPEEIEED